MKKTTATKSASAAKGSNGTSAGHQPAEFDKATVIRHYRVAVESRQASYLGRKEVLTGKAKFGIFGDGKEVAQLAMASAFQPGDWRSGYYRDQTFMFAIGESNVQKFFAQLYAHTDVDAEPASAGRSMNGHFATRFLDDSGAMVPQSTRYNVSADVSPTGSQMPRLVGLAYASVLYRELEELHALTHFSNKGNEVAFGTIGNASCAEGMFWESINALGVLRAPAVVSIWDDGYGISVPNEYQVTKSNVGELLQGFQRRPGTRDGFDVHVVRGWDYPALVRTYAQASMTARTEHVPQIVHVIDVTQPQGHSTSGSHERYKAPERLQWEKDFDGLTRMRAWMLESALATVEELDAIEAEAITTVKAQQQAAFDAYMSPILREREEAAAVMERLASLCRTSGVAEGVRAVATELVSIREPFRRDIVVACHKVLRTARAEDSSVRAELIAWTRRYESGVAPLYSSHLYSTSAEAWTAQQAVPAILTPASPLVNGSEIMKACFDAHLQRDPRIVAFGEDVGRIGDVNQGFAGLQAKYGPLHVADTGIRECTILGQAIGMAMRGLRPIAEIQYLDYLLYALQLMSDDLATVQWRTRGGQKAPVIIRTRGHRLEGVWHSGSPMAGIIHLVRGIHVCVPRNMTQAAGMYNLLLRSDEPALIVEVLNGYRLKEQLADNVGDYTVSLGVPEVLRAGKDVTIVTYGASCRPVLEAAAMLAETGVDAEVIDVQTLLPFDTTGVIAASLQRTGRIVFVDEDVPGGTTSYMMQQVLERQGGYRLLDSEPRTITAKEHRPAYGTDGNYWSKPEAEHIFRGVYEVMHEAHPSAYPVFY
jgi:pyruvate/2-oxoglutarate/acetoin dehydrogenase E1 component/TPP-dependent pyruvate/acetoin dehydrogenase alpha subunit